MSDIKVQLPDGSIREVPQGTTALDIAKSISPRLADAALAAKVAPLSSNGGGSVAVADDPQFMVIEIGSLTVPLDGLARAGIAGAAMIVVKLQAPDQELAPPTFAAVTSQ